VGHFVAQHKVAVGIGLGVLSVATGWGRSSLAWKAQVCWPPLLVSYPLHLAELPPS
jgi:hypothetical protein